MGIDFLDKTAKPFHRSCQKGYERLKSVYLFDPAVAPTQRSFLARLGKAADISEGLELVLRVEGDQIGLYRNECEIGRCDDPPSPLVAKIRETADGLAVGRLETLHPLSHSVDVVVL